MQTILNWFITFKDFALTLITSIGNFMTTTILDIVNVANLPESSPVFDLIDSFKDLTMFELLLGTGLIAIISYQVIKWILDIVL